MVGVYLSVWARRRLLPALRGVQVTAVGTGVMGYMGNKGARAARQCVPGAMPGAQSLGAGQLCVSLKCGRHRSLDTVLQSLRWFVPMRLLAGKLTDRC